jgi:hypothetical protein
MKTKHFNLIFLAIFLATSIIVIFNSYNQKVKIIERNYIKQNEWITPEYGEDTTITISLENNKYFYYKFEIKPKRTIETISDEVKKLLIERYNLTGFDGWQYVFTDKNIYYEMKLTINK